MTIDTGDPEGVGHRIIDVEIPSTVVSFDAASLSMIWVDTARLSRECLVSAVRAAQPRFLIHAVESIEECLHLDESDPDLVLYHSHSDETVEIDAVEALHSAYPRARLVILSDATMLPTPTVHAILSHDVAGFILSRRTGLQLVVSAIGLVHSGGTFVPRDFLFMDGQSQPASGGRKSVETSRLTQRELAVLDLVRLGQSNKLIAEGLGMSASTVKVHVRNIMQKMGASNRTQVALTAEQHLSGSRHRQV